MLSADEMRSTMELYLERVGRGDVEGVLALFSDSISVEDPVGGPPGSHIVGLEAVAEFFRAGFPPARPSPTLAGAIRTTAGNEAAMPFTLRVHLGDQFCELDVIDVMTFDPDGKISSLRAFWNRSEARLLT